MSFASINGVNAAKGMMGTQKQTTATFNPAAAAPAQPGAYAGMQAPGQAPSQVGVAGSIGRVGPGAQQMNNYVSSPGSSYTRGAGMQNTGAQPLTQYGNTGTGVNPGQAAPNAVTNSGVPNAPAFDPKDPRNAALAGYMA